MCNNQTDSRGGISAWAIVAIVAAALLVVILVVISILWRGGCLGRKRLLARGDYKAKNRHIFLEI